MWSIVVIRKAQIRLMLALAFVLHGGTSNAWTSASGPLSDAIHQEAIDKVLASMSASDRKTLKDQQELVDKDQEPSQSAEHAMTGITEAGQNEATQRIYYIALSEDLIHEALRSAIAAKRLNKNKEALTALGKAIHALQDATSPAHCGFQVWSYSFGIWEMARHVLSERVYPDDSTTKRYESHLEGAVQYAYDIYKENQPLPGHFFDSIHGQLILPDSYLHAY